MNEWGRLAANNRRHSIFISSTLSIQQKNWKVEWNWRNGIGERAAQHAIKTESFWLAWCCCCCSAGNVFIPKKFHFTPFLFHSIHSLGAPMPVNNWISSLPPLGRGKWNEIKFVEWAGAATNQFISHKSKSSWRIALSLCTIPDWRLILL